MPTGYPKATHPEMYKSDKTTALTIQDNYNNHADFEYALAYVGILIKRFNEGRVHRSELLAFMENFVQIWTGAE